MTRCWDAVIVGSGPNGLAAAALLARAGRWVLVVEGADTPGGACRTEALTLSGFRHDVGSAVHPLGAASPCFQKLDLGGAGLRWVEPPAAVAHPFDDRPAALIEMSVEATAAGLGRDREAYRRLFEPLVESWPRLVGPILGPPRLPPARALGALARFGLSALRSARGLARGRFAGERARGLFAGLAGHSVLPLDRVASAAAGLVLGIAAHRVSWPFPRGGADAIIAALRRRLEEAGGEIRTGEWVESIDQLPDARVTLFDIGPRQLLRLAGSRLPAPYRRRLERFRYGPGIFKLDLALSGPIPWRDPACARAATVHLGGTLDEIAHGEREAWRGRTVERPFVLLAQPSLFDPTRAPAGGHTVWAYCHVPHGSPADLAGAIENQIERFAPGFSERIVGRSSRNAPAVEAWNPNCVGGDITGGVSDLGQLIARPTLSRVPYALPAPGLYLCSSSTPPGGGVHGMCGYHAARAVLARELSAGTARVAVATPGAGGGRMSRDRSVGVELSAADLAAAGRAVGDTVATIRAAAREYAAHRYDGAPRDTPTLHLDDLSELPFLDGVSGVAHYQHRARLRAGEGDLFAAVVPPAAGYERYCREELGLGRPDCLVAAPTGGALAIAEACGEGDALERIVAAARRGGGLDIHPFLGGEAIWRLAARVAGRAGVEVRVVASPPPVIWLANDKQSFVEIVARVVGEKWRVEGESSRDPREMARALVRLARRHPEVGLKRLRCVSGMGNAIFDSTALRPGGGEVDLEAVLREVDGFLAFTEWDGVEQVQVVAWERASHSPSTQLWIPPEGAGPPRLDGVYEQILEGEQRVFAGSRPSTLPAAVNDALGTAALRVAAALQALGYVGRCSFDHLVVGDPEGDCELRFVECNGRWGGTSLPMHLLDRLLGRPRPPYRAQDFVHPALVGVPFAEVLERLGDTAWSRTRRDGRYLLYNVGPLAEHGKLDVIAMAADQASAERALTEDLPRRLGL